jgi:cytochrome P450
VALTRLRQGFGTTNKSGVLCLNKGSGRDASRGFSQSGVFPTCSANHNRHLAFGTGIHFCLGHQLARVEGRCALKFLFRRWPKLTLAVEPSAISWRKRAGLRAIERLPVAAGL